MSDQRSRTTIISTPPDWDVAKRWIDGVRAKSRKTASAYNEAINGFLKFVNKPIADIAAKDALEYVAHLNRSGLPRSAVNHQVSAIRSFLRHCQAAGIMAAEPLDSLKIEDGAIASMNRYVSQDEVERLLAAVGDILRRRPLGRMGRISIVLGIVLPLLLWTVGADRAGLGLLALIVSIPLWIGGMRLILYVGQWMLTEPAESHGSHQA